MSTPAYDNPERVVGWAQVDDSAPVVASSDADGSAVGAGDGELLVVAS
eukprot:SAG31_NODE_13105_length_892_cov_1.184111_1_plen_47_part_10